MTKSSESLVSFFLLLVLVMCVAMPGSCSIMPPGGFVVGLNRWLKVTVKPEPTVEVISIPKTRCLVFGFEGCKHCITQKRTLNQMSRNGWRVGPMMSDDIEYIDIKSRDERIGKYKHNSYPTLIIVNQAGREISRNEQALNADVLAEWIRSTRN